MNIFDFEVQRQAVKRAHPSYSAPTTGRALYVVQCNPELVFLFLSENIPLFGTEWDEEVRVRRSFGAISYYCLFPD
jgi:hypothetical protein